MRLLQGPAVSGRGASKAIKKVGGITELDEERGWGLCVGALPSNPVIHPCTGTGLLAQEDSASDTLLGDAHRREGFHPVSGRQVLKVSWASYSPPLGSDASLQHHFSKSVSNACFWGWRVEGCPGWGGQRGWMVGESTELGVQLPGGVLA